MLIRTRRSGPEPRRWPSVALVVLATVTLLAASPFPSRADTSTSTTVTPPTSEGSTTTAAAGATNTLSAEERAKRATAAGNLDAARAADSEIAAALQSINEAAQTTQSKIDQAESRLEAALSTLETATAELAESDDEQAAIEEQLKAKAVEGFKTGIDDDPGVFFTDRNMNQTLRQTQLLQQANASTAELLEDLRTLKEDRRLAQAEAAQAALDAEQLEEELTAELENLREQEGVQLRLRAEAQARIARWESELTAYAAEDEAIQQLIAEGSSAPSAAPQPREPSVLGYQWPINGRVTSGFGYRIHPIYGTRKLHSGLDVAAPRGTPISSTYAGVVIYTGWRGGYGNTVIVDHGGGLTSLYAHMTEIGIANGAAVERGDVVGFVGATGTATGNHLHFEIRFNGTPTDPAPYLP